MSLAAEAAAVPDDIPVIDLTGLRAGGAAAAPAVAAIGEACRRIGFFVVTGHGVPAETLQAAGAAARAFFALPLDEKMALSIDRSPHNRGYVRLQGETLNLARTADQKEAFNIGLDLAPDDPEVVAGKRFRGVNLWPDLPGWREAILDYFAQATELGLLLLSAFARDLGEPEDRFRPWMERPSATLRLLRYPPQALDRRPGDTDRIGAGEHTDYGALTLLTQLDGGGLEVRRRDGAWVPVPVIPGSFVCNIGECLMRASNDLYVATPHRVISTSPEQRHSIAFFFDPNPDVTIAPLARCVGPDRPARYPPVLFGDYLASRLDPTYGRTGGARQDG